MDEENNAHVDPSHVALCITLMVRRIRYLMTILLFLSLAHMVNLTFLQSTTVIFKVCIKPDMLLQNALDR